MMVDVTSTDLALLTEKREGEETLGAIENVRHEVGLQSFPALVWLRKGNS